MGRLLINEPIRETFCKNLSDSLGAGRHLRGHDGGRWAKHV